MSYSITMSELRYIADQAVTFDNEFSSAGEKLLAKERIESACLRAGVPKDLHLLASLEAVLRCTYPEETNTSIARMINLPEPIFRVGPKPDQEIYGISL